MQPSVQPNWGVMASTYASAVLWRSRFFPRRARLWVAQNWKRLVAAIAAAYVLGLQPTVRISEAVTGCNASELRDTNSCVSPAINCREQIVCETRVPLRVLEPAHREFGLDLVNPRIQLFLVDFGAGKYEGLRRF
jgi:hypothetical protein